MVEELDSLRACVKERDEHIRKLSQASQDLADRLESVTREHAALQLEFQGAMGKLQALSTTGSDFSSRSILESSHYALSTPARASASAPEMTSPDGRAPDPKSKAHLVVITQLRSGKARVPPVLS